MLETIEQTDASSPARPLPRIECRFLVTAWTSDVGDEHSLLGRVLRRCCSTR